MKNKETNDLPRVEKSSNISLTSLETTLIQKVHRGYAKVILEKELGGGYSGARVFLVVPVHQGDTSDARVVTKIGPADKLRHEFEKYESYAGRALPFTAAQAGEPYEQDGQAALNYAFVGDADLGKSLSLEEYYHTHTAGEVIQTLENLLGKALGPMWYGQSLPLTCLFRDEYGRHLPPHQELEEIVQKIFPKAVSADGSRVSIPGVTETFPNPLAVYPSILDKILKGRRSFVHGDLHLNNVLVDESGKAWLIDFAKVRERHNLFDFTKLEVYLRLIALAKEYGAFSLSEYVQFEQALNHAALNRAVEIPSNPKLKFAYNVISATRTLARNYQADQNGFTQEYLPALFIYTLAMTKYHFSNGDVPTRLIFMTGCILAKELLEDGESKVSQNVEKSISRESDQKNQPTDPEKTGGKSFINTTDGAHIGGNVTVQGDFMGRDKIDQSIKVGDISNSTGVAIGQNASASVIGTGASTTITELTLDEAFLRILEAVKAIPEETEKRKATEIIEKLETEARLGEQAKKERVERWLHFLAEISEDVWEVAINTFINPVKGLGTIFQKIAKKAREEKKEEE